MHYKGYDTINNKNYYELLESDYQVQINEILHRKLHVVGDMLDNLKTKDTLLF